MPVIMKVEKGPAEHTGQGFKQPVSIGFLDERSGKFFVMQALVPTGLTRDEATLRRAVKRLAAEYLKNRLRSAEYLN